MNAQELQKAKHYIRDLVSGSLFVAESKTVAESLLLDRPEEAWVRLFTEDNLLQKKSPNIAIRYARTIRRRLEPLGKLFIEAVVQASDPYYTQMLMLSPASKKTSKPWRENKANSANSTTNSNTTPTYGSSSIWTMVLKPTMANSVICWPRLKRLWVGQEINDD